MHHYVPKWYLRQFGTRTEIGVFDKKTRQLTIRHPRSVARIEGLNDINHPDLDREAIEDLLAEVESRAAASVRKLVARGVEGVSRKDRQQVADFVAAQFLRVPAHRAELVRSVNARLDRERARMSDDQINAIAGTTLSREAINLIRGPSLSGNEVEGIVGGGVILNLASHADDLLSGRWTWTLERVDRPTLFISDVPIRPITTGVEPAAGAFADMPLDPSTVLVLRSGAAAASAHTSRGFYLSSEGAPSAAHFQQLMIQRSDRWLFGQPENPVWKALLRHEEPA